MFIITFLIIFVILLLLLYIFYKLFKATLTGDRKDNLITITSVLIVPLILNIIIFNLNLEPLDFMFIQLSIGGIFILGFSLMSKFEFKNFITAICMYYICISCAMFIFRYLHLNIEGSIFVGFLPVLIYGLYTIYQGNLNYLNEKLGRTK